MIQTFQLIAICIPFQIPLLSHDTLGKSSDQHGMKVGSIEFVQNEGRNYNAGVKTVIWSLGRLEPSESLYEHFRKTSTDRSKSCLINEYTYTTTNVIKYG